MIWRLVSLLTNSLFWFALFVVVTGGFDHQGSLGETAVRIDATSPDLIVLLFLLFLLVWSRSGKALQDLSCIRILVAVYNWIVKHPSHVFFSALGLSLALYVAVPLFRHHSFQTGIDLAIFGQAYWNTIQGELLLSSIHGDMVLWGEHFNPIVVLILPLYQLWPSPETLLILQSLALVAGAIPLYALARLELPKSDLAVFFPLAYLLYQPLRTTNLFDFHPIVMATPLTLAAFYCMRRGRYGWFLILCLLVGATKETGPIAVGLLGTACALLNRKRWLGGAVVVLSALWFTLNLSLIMPIFNPSGVATQLDRYGYLGADFREILRTLLTRPFYVLSENFSSRELFYPFRILAPVAFLPLLTPVGLLTVPYLVINLLEHSGIQVWLVHYQSELTAFVFIAAIFGAQSLLAKRSTRTLAAMMMAGTFLFFGQSDSYRLREAWPTADSRRLHAVLTHLPANASVSAQAAIAPHVTQRRWLQIFPTIDRADWVIVDSGLDPWPVRPDRFKRTVKRLKRSGYEIVFDDGQSRIYQLAPPSARAKRGGKNKPPRSARKKKAGTSPAQK